MSAQTFKGAGGVVAIIVTIALALLAVFAASASADYEALTEHFGSTGEAEQLEGAKAMAINTTGAGGVEPGSIYVVGENGRVLRYGPGKEGEEPSFKEAWGWGVHGDKEDEDEYQRCGPALTTEPSQHTYHTCAAPLKGVVHPLFFGEGQGEFSYLTGVAIDPTNGDVYVRNYANDHQDRVRHLIEVFTATGTPVGEGFGELARVEPFPSESIAESPEKLHANGSHVQEDIAVDEHGVVYVTDLDFQEIANPPREVRVMSFEPEHPGDYEHYVYAGQSKDITATYGESFSNFSRLALVGGDRLVAANQTSIFEYALPGGGGTPVCSYSVPGAQLEGMTANPVTGEVFYFTTSGEKIHRLSACDPGTGTFTELQAPIAPTPKTETMATLAVNPGLSWGALRPEGVLYAADAEQHLKLNPPEHGIGDVFVPAKVFAPTIIGESVAGTTTDSSVLRAEVNPNGFTTDYQFQYLPASVYTASKTQAENEGQTPEEAIQTAFAGARQAPVGEGILNSGEVGVAAAGVNGLEAETEYRFRVITSSDCEGSSRPACTTSGEPASFSTYPIVPTGLADGRSYELVSPPEKHGGEVYPAYPEAASCGRDCKPESESSPSRFPMQSAPDGNSVVYMGDPFSASGGALFNEYLSKRTANGWQTTDLSPELQEVKSGSVVFDTGLGKDVIQQFAPQLSADAPAGYTNLYMQDASAPGVFTPLIVQTPPDRSSASFEPLFAGATADLSRVYFSANDTLTQETPFAPAPSDPGTFGSDLYEWREGALALVNVLPGNTEVAAGATFASAATLPNDRFRSAVSPDAHTVSTDGSRVFWNVAGRVYVRVDGRETLEVASSGAFLAASSDGSEVLLTDGHLYSFNEETGVYEQALDLTEGQGGFQGVLGSAEEDGRFSRIYYVDTEALFGSGENERHETAQSGQDNLYLWEAGHPRYIATLSPSDNQKGGGDGDWQEAAVRRTAQASPDGRWLAFMSLSPLTDYDNQGLCKPVNPGEPESIGACSEVFLYSAVTGRLSCVSCNPTGEAPRGPSRLRLDKGVHEWAPQPRYLTDAGRLVFDSGDRLSAADSNGRVEDVYEYEPDGVRSCARTAGCVLLISSGTGSVDSNFLAMDQTGANVFFTTRERLVPQDKDELIDLYDAREDGGFASQTETQRAECQGEACQPTPAPPLFVDPGSSTFSGAGNLLQPLPAGTLVKAKKTTAGSRATKRLRECRRQRSKRKRKACEKRARKAARRAQAFGNGKRGGGR